MKFRMHLSFSAAIFVATAALLSAAVQTRADFTLTGTAAELVGRGLNADFETPDVDLANNATEQTSTQNLGAGWNFGLISGVANNWGVADAADTFYQNVAPANLPAPFDGRQIGFFNLNNPFSTAEIVSSPIGKLQAGQTYTLNVAVGMRATATMNQVAYRVGLRASDGTDLGTFTTTTIVPAAATGTIADQLYTLDMNSFPSYVGDEVRIVIGGFNTSLNASGVYTNQNGQANFDNVRLAGTFSDLVVTPTPSASITINRQSGEILLSNTGSSNFGIHGYSLTSTNGSFGDQSGWTSIADNYDDTPGDGSVDGDDEWTILPGPNPATSLSESEISVGGDGGTLELGSPIDLGDAWLRTPFQDVAGTLLLSDGTQLAVTVGYDGLVIPSGDLNGDGDVTGADWTLFKAGQGTNFNGLSRAQAYLKGDLTGNLSHDLGDFFAFRTQYELFNGGSGSFARMLAGVPEPGAGLLLLLGGVLTSMTFRQRNRRGVFSMNGLPKMLIVAVVAVGACSLIAQQAAAQTTIAHWTFDTASLTTNAGNITGAADETGTHNAVNTVAAGSGGGCPCNSNGIPIANSIAGQFGQGLTLTGGNNVAGGGGQFLTYPNLNELSTVASAPAPPDYTVSYWIRTTTTNSHQFTVMSDWGTALANPGRFTYGFGFQFTGGVAEMRAQSRFNTSGTGNGTDIFARVDANASLNNGNWHMLTWTFDATVGDPTDGQLRSYFDGVLADTFDSTAANFNMIRSSSANGTFGLKGDTGNFVNGTISLDEAYVFTGVLDQAQITELFQTNTPPGGIPVVLTLRADPATGQVEIQNNSPEDISLSGYRITSSTGALNQAGWDAISTGAPLDGFPQGDGSGDGWEAPGEAGNNPADYNADGVVNNADFVMWSKLNNNGSQGYADWKANFGETSGFTLGGSDNELVEWWLTGASTIPAGEAIPLGQAFDIGGTQNLTFQYATLTGVISRNPEYGALGSGGGGAVPEPTSWLMLLAGCGIVACFWRRRLHACPAFAQVTACLVVTSVAVSSATAAVTNDRIYRFGENGVPSQTQENGLAGQPVGSGAGNPAPGTTLDHIGPSGSFQTLLAASCNNVATCPATNNLVPVYQDLSLVGTGRSGLGILFDGTDDYLNGFSLGFPSLTRSTINGGGTGTLNYNGVYNRGVQFWAYPQSGATAEQHVISDTTEHGVRITSGGNWMLRHGGTNVNSLVPVNFDQWSHVMVAMPLISQPHRAVLYVDGVALTAHDENYDTTAAVNAQALIIGADTSATGTDIGRNNFFKGTLDELEMFIWGRGYNHLTGAFTDFGTFNFATDNAYAASILTGVPGDVDSSGVLDQDDIDDFVAGWLEEKRVNNIRVGDLTTFANGDLSLDGITNLTDARLLIQALPGSGGGGLDMSGFYAVTGVPEPTTLGLAVLAVGGLLGARRRRN